MDNWFPTLISILVALNIVEYATGNPVFQISDEFRLFTNLLLGALLGFFILNFPFGKIFMGDAGAYFLGAIVCWGLIYAHLENGNSPWAVMCVLAYPFTDLPLASLEENLLQVEMQCSQMQNICIMSFIRE